MSALLQMEQTRSGRSSRESCQPDSTSSQARSLKRLSPFAGATSAAASANSTRLRWADSHVR